MTYANQIQLNRTRLLRRGQTEAEALLWRELRRKALDGTKFRRQYLLGPFVIDFYCPSKKLAVELDGGQHNEESKTLYDAQRTRFLEGKGIKVVRFWNNDVLKRKGDVMEAIWMALRTSPDFAKAKSPSPALRAREG